MCSIWAAIYLGCTIGSLSHLRCLWLKILKYCVGHHSILLTKCLAYSSCKEGRIFGLMISEAQSVAIWPVASGSVVSLPHGCQEEDRWGLISPLRA